jgi:predicted RNA-binding Zn ribbon-like protein
MPDAERSPIPVNPGDVACIDFVNSSFTHHLGTEADGDRIASSTWQAWFLDRYGLKPASRAAPPLNELVKLRRDLRRMLEQWSRDGDLSARDVRLLDGRIRAAPVRPRVASTGARLELVDEPLRRDWAWVLASVTTSAVELMSTGDPRRLKICDNPDCSWMFYDATVNRSRRFCSTNPCGSLIRVRQFRHPPAGRARRVR